MEDLLVRGESLGEDRPGEAIEGCALRDRRALADLIGLAMDHHQLLAEGGLYANLYRTQFADQPVEA